jgi:hypothetical protein
LIADTSGDKRHIVDDSVLDDFWYLLVLLAALAQAIMLHIRSKAYRL